MLRWIQAVQMGLKVLDRIAIAMVEGHATFVLKYRGRLYEISVHDAGIGPVVDSRVK